MKDIDIDKLTEPFIKVYQDLENDLIVHIATHFKLYENIGFKNSMEWYIKKIEELGGLNQEAIDIISKQTKISKDKIIKMLKEAGLSTLNLEDIEKANQLGIFNVDIDKLTNSNAFNDIINHSYKEINSIFKLINTKAIESSKQAYMDILNHAYTEVRSGIDYNTAIRKALTKMANQGITVATYKQKNGTIRRYSIESCVRRDVLTAVVQATNRMSDNFCKEAEYEYVIVSKHLGARVTETKDYKDHAWWQGKVYKIDGFDKEYPNFQDTCNEGDVQGFGGANCRHIKFGYIPGISVPPTNTIDDEENKKVYELSKKQRAYERKIRDYKRQYEVAKASGDDEKLKECRKKNKALDKEYNQFCKDNNLKRKFNREQVIDIKANRSKEQFNKENSYKDVTQDFLAKATPNDGNITIDNYFMDDEGIKHPIKDQEKISIVSEYSDEYKMAEILKEVFGGDIHLIPRIETEKGYHGIVKVSTPDFRWNGKKWDLKTPGLDGKFENTLERFLKKKDAKKQAKKFIIDYKNFSEKSNEEILKIVEKTINNRNWIEDIIVMRKNEIIKIYSKIR